MLMFAPPMVAGSHVIRVAHSETVEAEFWNRIKDSQDALLLEMYLKAFPDGEHARTVRERLDAGSERQAAPGPPTQGDDVVPRKRAYQRGEGGWVGLQIKSAEAKGFGSELGGFAFGAQIEKVTGHGPAARAGLALGDIIVAINGKATGKHNEFAEAVRAFVPGTEVTVTAIRDGKAIDLPLTIGGIMTDNLDAAVAGDLEAQFFLGVVLRGGLGVEKNQSEAVKWVRRAAQGGLAAAQTHMGYFHANGEGVKKNDVKAVEWYRKAEAQNESAALNNLGTFYEAGRGGLPKSLDQAIAYFRRSAVLGFQIAIDNLERLKVEPFDLAEIQRGLVDLGHDPGPVDGKMGLKTEGAIRAFQAGSAIPVDGQPSLMLAKLIANARASTVGGSSQTIAAGVGTPGVAVGDFDLGELDSLGTFD